MALGLCLDIEIIIYKYLSYCLNCRRKLALCLWCNKLRCICDDTFGNIHICSICTFKLNHFINNDFELKGAESF